MSAVITDADGMDWPPINAPYTPEDMRPSWTSPAKAVCTETLQLGDLAVRCERLFEGRHASERPDEHHGHVERPGKIWVTVSWRAVGR